MDFNLQATSSKAFRVTNSFAFYVIASIGTYMDLDLWYTMISRDELTKRPVAHLLTRINFNPSMDK